MASVPTLIPPSVSLSSPSVRRPSSSEASCSPTDHLRTKKVLSSQVPQRPKKSPKPQKSRQSPKLQLPLHSLPLNYDISFTGNSRVQRSQRMSTEVNASAMSFLPSAISDEWWRKPPSPSPSSHGGLFGPSGSPLDSGTSDFKLTSTPPLDSSSSSSLRNLSPPESPSLATCPSHTLPSNDTCHSARDRGDGDSHEAADVADVPLVHSARNAQNAQNLQNARNARTGNDGVPVYVMLPLDSVSMANSVSRPRAVMASLVALKSAGVEGVMMDVWWGIVEREGPRVYRWEAYRELVSMVRDAGLKVQAVMSFHQCGGNVGDHCFIPLAPWVQEEMDKNPDIAFTDRGGGRNREYVSLGCDEEEVLKGRTPMEVYRDFMQSFKECFDEFLGDVITEIQVGMGPAGELRYPSYPESNDRWRFPGIGEFQCYDKYMLASLKKEAESIGMPLWGLGGPHDSGFYKQWPEETGFFRTNGSWKSSYGDFFLEWYSNMLLEHGNRLLSTSSSIFHGCGVHISGKVAGIHWHYSTHSHAPELTAGYYNTVTRDGYKPLAQLFSKHGATLNFTCFEMRDQEQPMWAGCSPEGLLQQVVRAAKISGARISGENALPRYDTCAHAQIVQQSRLRIEGMNADEPMGAFTFLRMNERLFRPENWTNFVFFVRQMKEGRTFQPWEEEHHHSHLHVTSIGPLSQAAAAELMVR